MPGLLKVSFIANRPYNMGMTHLNCMDNNRNYVLYLYKNNSTVIKYISYAQSTVLYVVNCAEPEEVPVH